MSADSRDKNQVANGGTLLSRPVKIVNIGLDRFAKELEAQAVPVVQIEWAPPAGGNAKLAALLAKLGS
jgi:hypothetical protein